MKDGGCDKLGLGSRGCTYGRRGSIAIRGPAGNVGGFGGGGIVSG